MAIVTLQGITKKYGEVTAVHDFNLRTEDGEFVVLVGPSGCGKSTTLRMIAGLEAITGGELTIGDTVVNDLPPKDRDIAMVFQNYALYPHKDVYSNMAFSLKMRKTPRAEMDERVLRAAQVLGIEHLLDRKPRELSGGQRQRVALGRAIVREPQVFLMDEPLSNLDAQLRVTMRAEISKLHRRLGVTAFYVTHDQIEALTMGHRIAVMRDGLIQQVSTPTELYDRPANRFVAGFIGSPAMNFLRSRIDGRGEALEVEGFRISLDDRRRQALARNDSSEVWLGVRPEDITLNPSDSGGENNITGTVELVEPVGPVVEIQVRIGESLVIAQIDRHAGVAAGDRISLALDPANIHLFNVGTGDSLLYGPGHRRS